MRDLSMRRHNTKLNMAIAAAVIGLASIATEPAAAGLFQRCHRPALRRTSVCHCTASNVADQNQVQVGRAAVSTDAGALERQSASLAADATAMDDTTAFEDEAQDSSFAGEDEGTSWSVNDAQPDEESAGDESESYGEKGTYDSDGSTEESGSWDESRDAVDQRAEEAFPSDDLRDQDERARLYEPLDAMAAARRPILSADDLLAPDRAVLRELDALGDEALVARETVLESYLGSLGSEARDYFARWEAATSSDVRNLADNLSRFAALLATFRSCQRGEVTTDEALDLARGSMGCLPRRWIDAVTRISSERVYGAERGVAASDRLDRDWSPRRTLERGLHKATAVWAARLLDRWQSVLSRAPFWQTVRDQWAYWLGQPLPAQGAAALRLDVSGFGVHR